MGHSEYVFINRYVENDGTISQEIKHKFTGRETWSEVLEEFTSFLRGCGFVFDGEFALISPEDREHGYSLSEDF